MCVHVNIMCVFVCISMYNICVCVCVCMYLWYVAYNFLWVCSSLSN